MLGTVEEYPAQAVTPVITTDTALPAPLTRFGIGSSLTENKVYVAGGQDGAAVDQEERP